MLTRLNGLILIGNPLIPAVVALAIAGVFVAYRDDVARGWQETRVPLLAVRDSAEQAAGLAQDAVTNAMAKLASAGEGFEAVGDEFKQARDSVQPTLDTIAAIRVPEASVTWRNATLCPKPLPACEPHVSTGWIEVGADLAKPFQDIFDAMDAAGQPIRDVKAAMDELRIVEDLAAESQRAQIALRIAAKQAIAVARPLGAILAAVGYVAIGLLIWFALQFAVRGSAQMATGWRMLTTGRPPPAPTR